MCSVSCFRKETAVTARYAPHLEEELRRPRRRLVALSVFAEHADVSTKTIRRRISDGTLPAYRVGRLIKLDLADLERIAVRIPTVGGDVDVA